MHALPTPFLILQVFQSAKHMAATTYWYSYLNTPTDREILEFILHQYEILYVNAHKTRGRHSPSRNGVPAHLLSVVSRSR